MAYSRSFQQTSLDPLDAPYQVDIVELLLKGRSHEELSELEELLEPRESAISTTSAQVREDKRALYILEVGPSPSAKVEVRELVELKLPLPRASLAFLFSSRLLSSARCA